jgi:hypothetical protein
VRETSLGREEGTADSSAARRNDNKRTCNDNRNDNCNRNDDGNRYSKSNSRFPSGMTTRKQSEKCGRDF